jgi:negative regulator of flagellin synthesis FlgM
MVDIVKISNNYDQNLYVTGATKTQRINTGENKPAAETNETRPGDKVSLSKASKDIQLAKDAVSSTPDIRSEIVNSIRQQVVEGTYKVSAESVAEGIIDHHISEWV